MSIRVLLVDDHVSVCEGMESILEHEPDIRVVGLAHSGRRAVTVAHKLKPDVVVLDISMPDLSGIDALKQIQKHNPSVEAIMFSVHGSAEYISRSLKAGAKSYLLKEETARHLVRAVRAVHAGRRYFTKRLEAESGFVLDHSSDTDCKSPIESLSKRESEIVPLVAAGHSSSRIARELGLTTTTVETYRRRILQKLGVSNVAALTKFAVEHGFTPPA